MNKQVRYGIIGFGKQGKTYYDILHLSAAIVPNVKITAVCENRKSQLEFAKKHCHDVAFFEDYKEMIKSGLVDAVLVETNHYQHPGIVCYCLENNMNVLCDKPAGVYTKEARKAIEVANKHPELLFGMIYNQRTNPLYLKAKELIDSGELGKLYRVVWIITDWYRSMAYYNQGGWRGTWNGEGGGVLLNQCPHQLDLLTWLVGVPSSVTATAQTYGRDIQVENDVTAYFKYPNGATGVFITSTHDAPGTNRLEITGSGGKIVIENNKLVFTKNLTLEDEFSKINTEFWGKPKTVKKVYSTLRGNLKRKYLPEHLGILKDYADCLLDRNKTLLAPGIEGINGLTLSNAIHLSSWLNKEVSIPLDEDLFLQSLEAKKQEELKNHKYTKDYQD